MDDEADGSAGERPAGRSRRDVLKAGGLIAGGLAAGAVLGGIGLSALQRPSSPDAAGHGRPESHPAFEHIVVLMGENRSFDNMLGWLYTQESLPDGETFEGLAFGEHSNIAPDGTVVRAHVYDGETDVVMTSPNPDPGEIYPHVNTQLFGSIRPETNERLWDREMSSPFNAPEPGVAPTMSGFLTDYIVNYRELKRGQHPTAAEAAQIMGGFSPAMLPVLSTLAREFAVFDNWFAAVPSQTYCNRSFFHASTSHGFVTNRGEGGYSKWLDAQPAPTIFNRLDEAGVTWKVYFDEQQLVSLTGVMHAPVLEKFWKSRHFVHMDEFYRDARQGTLPSYAFIEPRMVYNHNDFHPPVGALRAERVDDELVVDSAISDVRAGEALVAKVYDAVRTSETADGSNALNTLLLITFDEHGGTYDHVPPGPATPPEKGSPEGEMGFTFDRLGARVPAIAISAYTDAGTIIHDERHHAAVISTLCTVHGLDPLTHRDDGAKHLFDVITRDTPRTPDTWPTVRPSYFPPDLTEDDLSDLARSTKPLSPPGKGLLGLLLARYGDGSEPDPESYADAYAILRKHGLGLFYPKNE